MDYMEKAWEVSLKVASFYAEEKYTDKDGLVWLGYEGDTHEEDHWVRADKLVSMSSADMTKKMINELNGWDETPVFEDPYEYNVERTSLEHGTSHLQSYMWLDWKDAEEHLSGFIEAEEIHEEEAGFRYATYRMVKRRKAGKAEDV